MPQGLGEQPRRDRDDVRWGEGGRSPPGVQPDKVVDPIERLGVLLDDRVEDAGLDERVDGLVRRGGIAADRRAGVAADALERQPRDVVEEPPTARGRWCLGQPETGPEPAVLVGQLAPAGILLGEAVRRMSERDIRSASQALACSVSRAASSGTIRATSPSGPSILRRTVRT